MIRNSSWIARSMCPRVWPDRGGNASYGLAIKVALITLMRLSAMRKARALSAQSAKRETELLSSSRVNPG